MEEGQSAFPCYYEEFKPRRRVEDEALAVHGLSNEHLDAKNHFAPSDADEITELLAGCSGVYAHNAEFEV